MNALEKVSTDRLIKTRFFQDSLFYPQLDIMDSLTFLMISHSLREDRRCHYNEFVNGEAGTAIIWDIIVIFIFQTAAAVRAVFV